MTREYAARNAEEAAAKDWRTPRKDLLHMARHGRGIVAHLAGTNSVLTRSDIEDLWREDSDALRMGLLRNPNVPQRLVNKAAEDGFATVRIAAALCPATTEATLRKLVNDSDGAVRAQAARRLGAAS